LLVARLAALIETDAKKIVALSTLRQLGLIFTALSLGLRRICYFHILIHALAKANLFIVIGRLLHSRFSQQDFRLITSSSINSFLVLRIMVRLISLTGITFTAGYYSKEQILIGQSFYLNRATIFILILAITGLTLSYCTKLIISIFTLNYQSRFQYSFIRITQGIPVIFLRGLSILIGFFLSANSDIFYLLIGRVERIYWSLFLSGVLILRVRVIFIKKRFYGFYSQLKLIDLLIKNVLKTKLLSLNLESSGREIFILTRTYFSINLIKERARLIFVLSFIRCAFVFL